MVCQKIPGGIVEILEIIKKRASTRKYQNKAVPKKSLEKIIEAGVWGPSVPSFLRIQPWTFIVVTRKQTIKELSRRILEKSKNSKMGVNMLLKIAANIVKSAPAVIAIYNSGDMKKVENRFKEIYSNFSDVIEKAQLSAISATIQNMILTAENLKLGSCWLDMPLFCKKEINRLLGTNNELIAFLTLGYPAETGKRALRKPLSEVVRYIK